MESGNLTTAQALAEVEQDPTLTTPKAKAKCDVYRNLVRWAHEPTVAEYPTLVGGACAEFPLSPG